MKDLFEKALRVWCRDPSDLEQRRITTVLLTTSVSYMLISSAFGVANLLKGNLFFAYTPFIGVAVVLFIAFPVLAITKNHVFAGYIVSSVLCLCTFLWLAFDVEHMGASLWAFAVVPYVFFVLGNRHGSVFMGINLCVIGLVLFWPNNPILQAEYQNSWKLRYVGALTLLTVVVYFFEAARAKAQSALEDENKKRRRTQTDLEAARQKAEAASEAKSRFLAHMSHELRTPLGGVIGMIGLLRESEMSENQRGYAKSAQRNAELLLTVINDILDFSKIEAGQMEFECVDFDLLSVMEQAFDAVSLRAARKKIELNALFDSDVPRDLVGDPLRLKQVLINLLGNAIKFTDEGEVWVQIRTSAQRDDLATLRFEVHDTGIGIDPEKMGRLFKSFSQVDESVSRRYGGTGLGLAISKAIVDGMGGQVGVESSDSGSIFWFTARFERGMDTQEDVFLERDSIKRNAIIASKNAHTILACQQRLAGLCEKTAGCRSLEEVQRHIVEFCEDEALCVHVLIDENLLQKDIGVLKRLRKQCGREKKMIIAGLYPYDGLPTKEQARALGLDMVVAKPPKVYELLRAVSLGNGAIDSHEETGVWGKRDERAGEALFVPEALRGKRVIIAEDNETLLEIARKILEKFELDVTCVDNGHSLLERLEREEFELVLTDIQMPVVDGMEVAGIIRDTSSKVLNHRIPIVALSAHIIGSEKESYLAAGFNDYLHKPVAPRDLLRVLCKQLGVELSPAVKEQGKRDAPEQVESPAFDVAGLLERYGEEEDLCRELVADFIRSLPGRVKKTQEAVQNGDKKAVKSLVHAIKGMALTFGAKRVADSCDKIERAIAAQGKHDEWVAAMSRETITFEKAASAWIQESRPQMSPRKTSRLSAIGP